MSIADKILATGKYLNVIKNYDKATQCSFSSDLIENHELYLQRQDFSECIDKAFDWANKELTRIVVKEKNLIDRLSSIKQYFFMEAGDLFIHFLDTAESELKKEIRLISPEKLQSLLEMSIRTSSAEKDSFKDDVYCYLSTGPYSDIINIYNASLSKTMKDGLPDLSSTTLMINPQPSDLKSKSTAKKGFEFFTLGYEVEWPLNLILSESNMVYYKLIFKNVFGLRFVELQLYNCWHLNMTTKRSDLHRSLTAYCLLLQRMINFVRSVLYSYSCEVIEDHWKTFILNVEQKVKRFDDLLLFHQEFVQNCVKDTMINDAWFSHKVGQILKVCLIVANYAEKYMNKIKTFEVVSSKKDLAIDAQLKGRGRYGDRRQKFLCVELRRDQKDGY